jgi:glycosyltransferase involved in cell wall biosynthesis
VISGETVQNNPEVSVVMGVYNGAESLQRTIDSILSQEDVDFEFIIVNDGSTDSSKQILDEYASQDNRLRIIHQENAGLTQALIRGCAEAKGEFIARQDAGGDISYSGRLNHQARQLWENPHAVLTSCGTHYVDPDYETLYEVQLTQQELNEGLHQRSLSKLKGPSHHGSVMLRRSIFEAVGGYRAEFRVAQDLDLWIRIAEQGLCLTSEKILYEAVWAPTSVSSRRRSQQFLAAQTALNCADCRKQNMSENELLKDLDRNIRQSKSRFNHPKIAEADSWYFMGATALKYSKIRARRYWRESIKSWPFHFKSWWRLLTN